MRRRTTAIFPVLLLRLTLGFVFAATLFVPARANDRDDSPAFTTVPELADGFHHLYAQQFSEARQIFDKWGSAHPDQPFGQVAVAASYLFEEMYRQNVLSSDFFLDEKRFLHGIEGKPDPARMQSFREALERARTIAKQRLKQHPKDPEGLFALAMASGMESDGCLLYTSPSPRDS